MRPRQQLRTGRRTDEQSLKVESMKPFSGWIALSSSGNVAWFIGIWRKRAELELEYAKRFGHSLRQGGYKPMHIQCRKYPKTGDPL